MALSVVNAGAQVATNTAGATLTPPLPTGTAQNDLLLCIVAGEPSGTTDLTVTAGWTRVENLVQRYEIGVNDLTIEVWYKTAGSGETAPTIATNTSYAPGGSANGVSAQILAIRGQDQTTGSSWMDATAVGGGSASSTTWTPPSISTNTANALVISCVATSDDNALNLTTANGFVPQMSGASYDTTVGGDHAVGVATLEKAATGSTTMCVWNQTLVVSDQWVGITLAVKPAPASNQSFTTNTATSTFSGATTTATITGLFSDNFNRANATTLGANWTRQEGDDYFEIVSNQAKWVAGGYSYERYTAGAASSPDMYAQVYVTAPSSPSGMYPGVTVRCATSGLTCYSLSFNGSGWAVLRYTGTGATETQIGPTYSTTLTGAATYKLRLEVSGTGATVTLKGYVDDVLRVDTTDTSASRIVSGTQGGITHAGQINWIFDDFSGGNLPAGAPVTNAASAAFSAAVTTTALAFQYNATSVTYDSQAATWNGAPRDVLVVATNASSITFSGSETTKVLGSVNRQTNAATAAFSASLITNNLMPALYDAGAVLYDSTSKSWNGSNISAAGVATNAASAEFSAASTTIVKGGLSKQANAPSSAYSASSTTAVKGALNKTTNTASASFSGVNTSASKGPISKTINTASTSFTAAIVTVFRGPVTKTTNAASCIFTAATTTRTGTTVKQTNVAAAAFSGAVTTSSRKYTTNVASSTFTGAVTKSSRKYTTNVASSAFTGAVTISSRKYTTNVASSAFTASTTTAVRGSLTKATTAASSAFSAAVTSTFGVKTTNAASAAFSASVTTRALGKLTKATNVASSAFAAAVTKSARAKTTNTASATFTASTTAKATGANVRTTVAASAIFSVGQTTASKGKLTKATNVAAAAFSGAVTQSAREYQTNAATITFSSPATTVIKGLLAVSTNAASAAFTGAITSNTLFQGSFVVLGNGQRARVRMANGKAASIRLSDGKQLNGV